MRKFISKKAQEEIMGFGIILLLIAVIGIVFLSISINKNAQKQQLEDYEISSFLKAMMETSTSCEKNTKYLSIKDIAFECQRNYLCYDGDDSCDVFNNTVKEIMSESWDVGVNNSIKGYNLLIQSEDETLLNISSGSSTSSYKGASQNYAKSLDEINVFLKVYT